MNIEIKKYDQENASVCNDLLTKLINEEIKYDENLKINIIINDYYNKLNENSVIYIAFINNKVVGYIYGYVAEDILVKEKTAKLDALYVIEEYRGNKIASKLIEEYKVSRNTIRNAIKILINLGIVYSVQGNGMFVRAPKKKGTVYLNSTRGVTMDNPGNKIVNKLLDIQVIEADEKLSQQMNCKIGTPVYYLKRLRIVDGIPYALERTYYNKDIVPYLGKEIAEGSIFRYLKDDLKLSFGFADKYLTAIKLSKEDAKLLNLNENDPAIMINDNIHLSNGLLFNTSNIIYNYQATNFYSVAQ